MARFALRQEVLNPRSLSLSPSLADFNDANMNPSFAPRSDPISTPLNFDLIPLIRDR